MNDYYRLKIKADRTIVNRVRVVDGYGFIFSDEIEDWIHGTNSWKKNHVKMKEIVNSIESITWNKR